MGMSDLWLAEQEQIMERLDAGKIEEDDAVKELQKLGFDKHEALDFIQTWRS